MKESDIPVEVIFNQEINAIKEEELEFNKKPKPITFNFVENEHGNHVRYEIEGGGKVIETMIVRQNEKSFFDFIKEFNEEGKVKKPRSKHTSRMTFVFRPKSRVSTMMNKKRRRESKMSRVSIASIGSKESMSDVTVKGIDITNMKKARSSPHSGTLNNLRKIAMKSKFRGSDHSESNNSSKDSIARYSTRRVSKLNSISFQSSGTDKNIKEIKVEGLTSNGMLLLSVSLSNVALLRPSYYQKYK